jgi:hypothetical protein
VPNVFYADPQSTKQRIRAFEKHSYVKKGWMGFVPGEISVCGRRFGLKSGASDKKEVNGLGSSLRLPSEAKRRLSRRSLGEGGPM